MIARVVMSLSFACRSRYMHMMRYCSFYLPLWSPESQSQAQPWKWPQTPYLSKRKARLIIDSWILNNSENKKDTKIYKFHLGLKFTPVKPTIQSKTCEMDVSSYFSLLGWQRSCLGQVITVQKLDPTCLIHLPVNYFFFWITTYYILDIFKLLYELFFKVVHTTTNAYLNEQTLNKTK